MPDPRPVPIRGIGTKESPIELDYVEDDIEIMDTKPPAITQESFLTNVAPALSPFTDFTCAICLDDSPSMTDIASISGCTHRFCFDCIEKWAETENSCPCCTARFRTIDRVIISAPPNPTEAAAATEIYETRSIISNENLGTMNADRRLFDRTNRSLNSRTVEDRNQPSVRTSVFTVGIDTAREQTLLEDARLLLRLSSEPSRRLRRSNSY